MCEQKFSLLMIYEINHTWTAEMKWKWRNDRRSERNLCNCVKKPEKKIQDFNRVWTRDLAIPLRWSTNWAMKLLTLGAGQLWVHMFPWKKWVLMIYEINHIWTAEMKFQTSLPNCINCVHCDDHFFIFKSFLCLICSDALKKPFELTSRSDLLQFILVFKYTFSISKNKSRTNLM